MSIFVLAYSRYFSTSIHGLIDRLKTLFNLSWMIVRMSYHWFNDLAEPLNVDLAETSGRGVLSCDLWIENVTVFFHLDLIGNASTNVNARFFSIYEVKFSICGAVHIGNTQQTFKKRADGHFSDLLRLLQNGQKSDSFACPFQTTL